MRIALYGGSFNPPHIGHGLVCYYLLETAPIDQVWLIPTFEHAFGKALAPYADRMDLCRALAAPFGDRVQVSNIEQVRGGASYTIDTVRALLAAYPEHQLEWVIGADLLLETDRWKDFDTLTTLISFRIIGRSGYEGGPGVDMPAVSSTQIRERCQQGLSIDGLVPRRVQQLITDRMLYTGRTAAHR